MKSKDNLISDDFAVRIMQKIKQEKLRHERIENIRLTVAVSTAIAIMVCAIFYMISLYNISFSETVKQILTSLSDPFKQIITSMPNIKEAESEWHSIELTSPQLTVSLILCMIILISLERYISYRMQRREER